MTDSYLYIITALLPLSAAMLVCQVNPYHALVIRGILGAVATLVYTVLGAADVALTEALVGTLLAMMLYAVAVRSSLVIRLGVLKDEAIALDDGSGSARASQFKQLINELRTVFDKHHMRVDLVPYFDNADLQQALIDKDVHAICAEATPTVDVPSAPEQELPPYHTTTRLRRLYDIIHTELASPLTRLTYVSPSSSKEAHG